MLFLSFIRILDIDECARSPRCSHYCSKLKAVTTVTVSQDMNCMGALTVKDSEDIIIINISKLSI